jgi:hypothetical protein
MGLRRALVRLPPTVLATTAVPQRHGLDVDDADGGHIEPGAHEASRVRQRTGSRRARAACPRFTGGPCGCAAVAAATPASTWPPPSPAQCSQWVGPAGSVADANSGVEAADVVPVRDALKVGPYATRTRFGTPTAAPVVPCSPSKSRATHSVHRRAGRVLVRTVTGSSGGFRDRRPGAYVEPSPPPSRPVASAVTAVVQDPARAARLRAAGRTPPSGCSDAVARRTRDVYAHVLR